jgi:hypothetical protein
MTAITTGRTPPAEAVPGSAAVYGTAAALAVTAERLADAIDDNRPDWLHLAEVAECLLEALVIAKASDPADDFEAAELYAAEATADLYQVAADLSATAGDIAADIAEGRTCPGNVTRACRLLAVLADTLGGGE